MKSLDGRKMFWLWHPEGPLRDPRDIAEKALTAGVTAVAAKVDDGGYPFSDAETDFGRRPDRIIDFILKLRTAGVAAGLWGYHYGRDLDREASMVRRAINFRPDFYIVDWEAEFMEQHADAGWGVDLSPGHPTIDYLASIRDYRNREAPCVGLFHAPLAQPRYHKPALYRLFQHYFDGMMPQIYHRAMGLPIDEALALCYDDYAHYGLMEKPIWPAGQAYNVPPEEVLAWGQRATQIYGAKGLSWWKFEDATNVLEAVRSVSFGGEMRRANGYHPDYGPKDRRILSRGVHAIPIRSKFGLMVTDTRVVLDLELLGLPSQPWPVVIVRDGSGAFAGYLDGAKPRDQFTVYMGAGPEGVINVECIGAEARVALFGILEVG